MEIIGSIPCDETLSKGSTDKVSDTVFESLKQLYFRLNLPQENN